MSSYKLLAAPKLTGCAITLTLTSSPGAREGYNPKPNLNPNPNPDPDPDPNQAACGQKLLLALQGTAAA